MKRFVNQADKKKIINLRTISSNRVVFILWQTALVILLTIGVFMVYFSWIPLEKSWILKICLAGTVILTGSAVLKGSKKTAAYCPALPAAAGILSVIVSGPVSVYHGLFGFLNYLVGWWNLKYEDGKNLFTHVQITEKDIAVFSLALLFFTVAFIWIFVQKKSVLAVGLSALILIAGSMVIGCFSSISCGFILAGAVGVWLTRLNGSFGLRIGVWTAGIGMILLVFAFLIGNGSSSALVQLKKTVSEKIEVLRYGEDTLPEGDIRKASFMLSKEENTLTVTSQQAKDIYLRGYIGSRYVEGCWKTLKKAAFGGEKTGLMKWLEKSGLKPAQQYASYVQADGEDVGNYITIKNTGAKRKYIYLPYSAWDLKDVDVRPMQDAGWTASEFLGATHYTFREESQDLPSELLSVSDWIFNPEEDAQVQYAQAEEIYRNFVYENYLEVDDSIQNLIESMFWEDAEADDKIGIYRITQRIRTVFEQNISYRSRPETIPENEEPLQWFLTQSREGNSVLFASAAVEAYRCCGIPARYAEGYLLRKSRIQASGKGQVKLTNQDSHAWVEVYMDGIGWVPVDVTPGFYYDTYALMEMLEKPKGTQKTADIEDTKNQADDLQGDGQGGMEQDRKKGLTEKIYWGAVSLLLVLILVGMCILFGLEILRFRRLLKLQKYISSEKTDFVSQELCHIIYVVLESVGIESCLGWQAEKTEENLCRKIPVFMPGEYQRVSHLMEKYVYGDEILKSHERRVLLGFIEKIYRERKVLTLKERLKLRYCRF